MSLQGCTALALCPHSAALHWHHAPTVMHCAGTVPSQRWTVWTPFTYKFVIHPQCITALARFPRSASLPWHHAPARLQCADMVPPQCCSVRAWCPRNASVRGHLAPAVMLCSGIFGCFFCLKGFPCSKCSYSSIKFNINLYKHLPM